MSMSRMNAGAQGEAGRPDWSAGWNSEFDRVYALAAARIRGEYPAYVAARLRAGLDSARAPVGPQDHAPANDFTAPPDSHGGDHAPGVRRRYGRNRPRPLEHLRTRSHSVSPLGTRRSRQPRAEGERI
jgi:hypothetical protein